MRQLIVASTLLIVGCAHKQPAKEAAAPTPAVAQAPTPKPVAAPTAAAPAPATCANDLDCGARQLCVDSRCVDITAGLAACNAVAHFDFDKSALHDEDRGKLERTARCLKATSEMRMTVEGHCDERGTEEYNLALGDRRAHAVVDYLKALGAPVEQVKAVSYGEMRPLCEAHHESCWWQNRRAMVQRSEVTAHR